MNLENSFTLLPSYSGTFYSFQDDCPRDCADSSLTASCGSTINSSTIENDLILGPKSLSPQHHHHKPNKVENNTGVTIQQQSQTQPALIVPNLIGNWELSKSKIGTVSIDQAPRSIRASPFWPAVHLRNLPKGGTISPLKMDEYYLPLSHNYHQYHPPQSHFCTPSPQSQSIQDDTPPVFEIRIPTPAQHDPWEGETLPTTGDDRQEADAPPSCPSTDWKSLYFCSQRDLFTMRQRFTTVAEENRALKRCLIEMQKQLNEDRRNSRRRSWHESSTGSSSMWTIPHSKRMATSPVEKRQDQASSSDLDASRYTAST